MRTIKTTAQHIVFIYDPVKGWVPENAEEENKFQELDNETVFFLAYFLVKNLSALIVNH